jgi:hypothetical protein
MVIGAALRVPGDRQGLFQNWLFIEKWRSFYYSTQFYNQLAVRPAQYEPFHIWYSLLTSLMLTENLRIFPNARSPTLGTAELGHSFFDPCLQSFQAYISNYGSSHHTSGFSHCVRTHLVLCKC